MDSGQLSVVSGQGGEGAEALAPFYVEVWDVEVVVEALQAGVELFVLVVLPLGGGGVAEEDAAAEGADGVDGAEAVELERTTSPIPRTRR